MTVVSMSPLEALLYLYDLAAEAQPGAPLSRGLRAFRAHVDGAMAIRRIEPGSRAFVALIVGEYLPSFKKAIAGRATVDGIDTFLAQFGEPS